MNNQNDIYRELPDYLTDGVYFTDFVAIIANAGEKELVEVGERMRALVERSMLNAPEHLFVTVSIGGAQAATDDTIESLVQRAGEKLYQAKKSGENRVCI